MILPNVAAFKKDRDSLQFPAGYGILIDTIEIQAPQRAVNEVLVQNMIEQVTPQTLAEFEAFVESHPKGHFAQSSLWAKQKPMWQWKALMSRDDDGAIRGALSVLVRKVPGTPYTLMYACRGPVCDVHETATLRELLDGARALAKSCRSYCLKIDPDVPSSDRAFFETMRAYGFRSKEGGKNFEAIQPRYVFRLALEGRTEEELLASFQQKTRYNIRLAQRKGVEVRIEGKTAVPEFARLMLETGVRDGFVTRQPEYFAAMLDNLGEHARLYMAYHEGVAIAGTLAIAYGDKVWYLYGASSNEHRNLMPNYLLQWNMIQWAVERGARIYDFRGVSGDLSEDNPLYGLYKFKKGFNGEFTEFVGELDLVLRPTVYFAVEHGTNFLREARRRAYLLKNRDKRPPTAEG